MGQAMLAAAPYSVPDRSGARRRRVAAIMQPTFLPWAGYFNLIASADVFVFLDTVQIEKQSWQTRNRILINGAEHLLSIPVDRGTLGLPLQAVKARPHAEWLGKMRQTLVQAYAFSAFLPSLIDCFDEAYGGDDPSLVRMNSTFITAICSVLGLTTPFVNASALQVEGTRSERLIALCRAVDADLYLSPQGASDYLREDGFDRMDGPALEFQHFVPHPYPQRRAKSFVSHLSIVDVFCHLGPAGTKSYIGA